MLSGSEITVEISAPFLFTFMVYVDLFDNSPLYGMIYMLSVEIFCWTNLTNQDRDQILYSILKSVFKLF